MGVSLLRKGWFGSASSGRRAAAPRAGPSLARASSIASHLTRPSPPSHFLSTPLVSGKSAAIYHRVKSKNLRPHICPCALRPACLYKPLHRFSASRSCPRAYRTAHIYPLQPRLPQTSSYTSSSRLPSSTSRCRSRRSLRSLSLNLGVEAPAAIVHCLRSTSLTHGSGLLCDPPTRGTQAPCWAGTHWAFTVAPHIILNPTASTDVRSDEAIRDFLPPSLDSHPSNTSLTTTHHLHSPQRPQQQWLSPASSS